MKNRKCPGQSVSASPKPCVVCVQKQATDDSLWQIRSRLGGAEGQTTCDVVCSGSAVMLLHIKSGHWLVAEGTSVRLMPREDISAGQCANWVVLAGPNFHPWRASCANDVAFIPESEASQCLGITETTEEPSLIVQRLKSHERVGGEDLPPGIAQQRWYVAAVCGRNE